MTLRQRLLATTLAVAVPLTAILYFVAERYRHADMMSSIERQLSAELSGGLIERCETDGGLRRPPPPGDGRRGPGGGRGGPIELKA